MTETLRAMTLEELYALPIERVHDSVVMICPDTGTRYVLAGDSE